MLGKQRTLPGAGRAEWKGTRYLSVGIENIVIHVAEYNVALLSLHQPFGVDGVLAHIPIDDIEIPQVITYPFLSILGAALVEIGRAHV